MSRLARFIPLLLILLSITGIIFGAVFLLGIAEFLDPVAYSILGGASLLIFFIVSGVIYAFYDRPIKKLEHTIKRFISGASKDKDISFEKSLNPHIHFVLRFFEKTLNTLKHIKSEFLHGKEIKGEVELASEIQGKLLGKKIPDIPHLEIVAKSKPAGEIGGDSFDIIENGENHYIYVGDATGHGVGAGFIMMMVNALISAFIKVTPKGHHILALTNDILKPRVKANLLMSMLLVRWNSLEKKIYMTGAGHEYLMIYKYKDKKCYRIKSGGVALGMTRNIHKLLKEQQIDFQPNDIIILYSDGITEAINKPHRDGEEEMFGENMLVRSIEGAPDLPMSDAVSLKTARSVFKNISINLSKFMGYKHIQLDDITLLTIQYTSSEYNKEKDCSIELEEDFITEWNWD